MGEWKEYKLGDLFDKSNQGVNTTTEKVKYSESGIPVIRAKNIYVYKIDFDDVTYVEESTFQDLKSTVKPVLNDVLYTNIGSQLGNAALVKNPEVFLIAWNVFRITPTEKLLHPNFLVYLFNNPETKEFIKNLDSSSTMPFVSGGVLRTLEFLIPPLPEQKAIASVLSSLDDKIDLLHRQNKTLEAMAETLFRQWFVEEAQEDWEAGCLGDVIELVYGKGLKKEMRTGTGYPVIGSSGVVGYHSEFLAEGPGVVIGRKGTLGKVIYLWDNFFPIDTTYYIKSKVESAGLLYEYFLLKTLNFEEMNSDSAVPGLNRDIALSTEIKIAPLEKLHKFNQFTSIFIDKLRENTKQIRTLEKLRDTLLPRLMSGEVRVKSNKEKSK